MRAEIGDRVVLHGRNGTRIGVIVEVPEGDEAGGSRVRWADGGESAMSVVSEAAEQTGHATWDAAKTVPAVTWRRGVTAGVGHEASLAQEKLAAKVETEDAAVADDTAAAEATAVTDDTAVAEATAVATEAPAEHKPASGE